ncbi:MAG: hypothetical protein LQ345_003839 [Seirophora villosa]|nr:MAG: hypothetical protein LQ345_003839 [Seirophora villosa]
MTHAASSSPADQADAGNCAHLEAKIASLQALIGDTSTKLDQAAAKLKNSDASQTVQNHIRLLRDYNDMRDVGTSLMGIIAESRPVQMKKVYEDYDVNEKD